LALWKTVKKLKSRISGLPVCLFINGHFEIERQAIFKAWWVKFARPLTMKASDWATEVYRDLATWDLDVQESWGGHSPTEEELLFEAKQCNLASAPGNDRVTMQMLFRAFMIPSFRILLIQFFHLSWQCGELGDHFFSDVIVPIFKRNSIYVPSNYRPISLMNAIAKWLQKVCYSRVNRWSASEPLGGLTGIFQFGGIKGLNRHFMVWILEAVSHLNPFMILFTRDVDNAFPTLFQDGVDWILWKAGVRGKLWKMLRMMEKHLHGVLRINGNMSDPVFYKNGGNQGAISMPHRWIYFIGELFKRFVTARLGIVVDGLRIPGVGFIDDFTFMTSSFKMFCKTFSVSNQLAQILLFTWSLSKDSVLFRGIPPSNLPLDSPLFLRVPPKVNEDPSIITKHMKILGEWLSNTPGRSLMQVSSTLKAMRFASHQMTWIITSNLVDPDVIKQIFESTVESIATSMLVLSTVLESEFSSLESIKASFARSFLAVHVRTSVWAVYAELGWSSVRSAIYRAKLGLLGKLFRGEGGILVQHIPCLSDYPECLQILFSQAMSLHLRRFGSTFVLAAKSFSFCPRMEGDMQGSYVYA